MFNLSDSIAAIATPPGSGGIAIVRISGILSWEIIKKIFHRKDNYSLEHMKALYGYILDEDKKIDEVIVLPFKSPKSFTAFSKIVSPRNVADPDAAISVFFIAETEAMVSSSPRIRSLMISNPSMCSALMVSAVRMPENDASCAVI